MNEILRRALLVLGTLAAAVLFCVNSGRLVLVQIESAIEPNQMNMVEKKSGKDWDGVLHRVTALGRTDADGYFSPDEPPFPDFLRELAKTDFAYGIVQMRRPQGEIVLSIHPLEPRWIAATAPLSVAYPFRWLSYWILGATLIAYFAIPLPKRLGNGVMQYPRYSGPIADLGVALPLTVVFFSVPLLVIGQNSSTGSLTELFSFREGWAFLTLCMWGMAILAGSILWFSAWYSVYAAAVRPEGIWIRTVRGEREYRFDEIVGVEPSEVGLPRWARRLMWLAPLLNWRSLAPVVLAETSDLRAIDLVLENGDRVRLPIGGLRGTDGLLDDLKRKASGKARSTENRLVSIDRLQSPWFATGWIEYIRRGLLLLGIGGAAFVYFSTTSEIVQLRPTDFPAERARHGDLFYIQKFQSMSDYLSFLAEADAGRVSRVTGGEWERLFANVGEPGGVRSEDVWARGFSDPTVHYPWSETPDVLREWFAGRESSSEADFIVLDKGAASRYMAVTRVSGPEIAYRPSFGVSRPSAKVLHPLRRWTWLPFTVAAATYAFIPWRRRQAGLIASPLGTAMLEDLVACLFLIATVAWLVIVLIPYLIEEGVPPADEMAIFFGLTAVGGVSTLAFAADGARRAGVGVVLGDDGLLSCSVRELARFRYCDLTEIRDICVGPGLMVSLPLLLVGLVIWPLLPLGALLLSAREAGVEIRFRDGGRLRVRGISPRSPARKLLIHSESARVQQSGPAAAIASGISAKHATALRA